MKNRILIAAGLLVIILLGVFASMNIDSIISDSMKFKKEYEGVNGTTYHDKKIRNVSIDVKNKIKYLTPKELLEKIDNDESFVVYFGFKECPWCRSIIESLISVSNDSKVENLYYVDVKEIRDTIELDNNNKLKVTKKGTDEYYELLKRMDNVLTKYNITNKENEEIDTNEKRIYAPNIVSFVEGKAIKMETGISKKETDPYMELTKGMTNYTKKTFKCLFKCVEDSIGTCTKDNMC